MGKAAHDLKRSVQDALNELEAIGDEIRVKLHLAELDANKTWSEKLEPQLFQARLHAHDAKSASKAAIDDTIRAFKEFAAAL